MRAVLLALVPFAIATTLHAQTTTWTGRSSWDWRVAANWDNGVPTSTATAIIVSAGFEPVTGSGTLCDTLIVRNGARLHIQGSASVRAFTAEANTSIDSGYLTVTGPFDNAGMISLGLTVAGPFDNRGQIAPGTGVVLTGTGLVRGTLPNRSEMRGVDRTFSDVDVTGSFQHSSGVVRVDWLNIQGQADFRGANVVGAGRGVLILGSSTQWNTSALVTNPPANIQVYGSWSSDSDFRPTTGLVRFRGFGDVYAAGSMHDIELESGTQVVLQSPLTVTGSATINGSVLDGQFGGLVCRPSVAGTRISGNGTVDELQLHGDMSIAGTLTVRRDLFIFDNATHLTGLPGSRVVVQGACECHGYYQLPGDMELLGDLRIMPSATFTPVEGRIIFRGTQTQHLTSTALNNPRPATVIVNAGTRVDIDSVETITHLIVSGSVTVRPWANGTPPPEHTFAQQITIPAGGSFTYADTRVPLRAGNFRLDGSATLVGPTNVFTGDVLLQRPLITDPGATMRFEGTGVATGTFPALTVAGLDRRFASATVNGALQHTSGTLRAGALQVTGSMVSRGALFANNGGTADSLIVGQDLTLDTTGVCDTPPATIRVAGNWQSSANFRPTTGRVVFEGVGARTALGLAPAGINWADLEVAAATVLTLNGDLRAGSVFVHGRLVTTGSAIATTADLELDNGATLSATSARTLTIGRDLNTGIVDAPLAVLDVTRNVLVNGRLTLGAGSHRIGGSMDAVSPLTFGAGSLLRFTGSGRILNGSTGPLPDVEISGSYGLDAVTIAGSLTQTASSPSIGISTARVAGNATFAGGRVIDNSFGGGLLDVAGSVTFSGAGTSAVNPPPEIRCGGDWTANANFAPVGGRVVLQGSGVANLRTLDTRLQFHELVVQRQSAFANTPCELVASTLRIEPAGQLDVRSGTIDMYCDVVDCRGALRVGAGGVLRAGPMTGVSSTVTIGAGGTLRVVGAASAPAAWRGTAPASYGLQILGTLEAQEFEFRDMDAAGVRIASSATIAPAPLDLRGGVFGSGATSPGAVLLQLDRPAGQPQFVVNDIVFDNWPATATHNVRTRSPGRIAFAAANGNFFGAQFEDDPAGVIDWSPFQRSELTFTAALGSLNRVHLAFASTHEVDDVAFAIWRGDTAQGPFATLVGGVVPTGAPGHYDVVDRAPLPTQRHFYQLVALHRRGVARAFGVTEARSLSASFGPVRVVGPGGFPDINAALQAGPGVTVLVDSGVYPPFRVAFPAAVRALPGANVRIDASTGPVIVEDVAGDAGLHDLTITATAGPALLVRRCASVLALDELRIQSGDPAGAVQISDSPTIILQWCEVAGGPTTLTRTNACAWGGTLADLRLTDRSRLVDAALLATRQSIDVTSSRTSVAGLAPRLDGPTTWHEGQPAVHQLSANPGDLFVYLIAASTGFYDLRAYAPLDMLLLLGLESLQQPLFTGVVDIRGEAAFALYPPVAPELWGLSLNAQVVVIGARNPPGRFSNVHRVMLAP